MSNYSGVLWALILMSFVTTRGWITIGEILTVVHSTARNQETQYNHIVSLALHENNNRPVRINGSSPQLSALSELRHIFGTQIVDAAVPHVPPSLRQILGEEVDRLDLLQPILLPEFRFVKQECVQITQDLIVEREHVQCFSDVQVNRRLLEVTIERDQKNYDHIVIRERKLILSTSFQNLKRRSIECLQEICRMECDNHDPGSLTSDISLFSP
jgi:hypothetical protein